MHPMYMAKDKPLRWRPTQIRAWRDLRNITLEGAAAALAKPPYRIETTHVSLGRVELGKQMPNIGLIEALAILYRTDVYSLLNRAPTHDDAIPGSASEILKLWDMADDDGRHLIANVAKRVVNTIP